MKINDQTTTYLDLKENRVQEQFLKMMQFCNKVTVSDEPFTILAPVNSSKTTPEALLQVHSGAWLIFGIWINLVGLI